MLPKIELIGLDDPNVRGAAIEVPGRPDPIFVLPFPKHGLKEAFVLSNRLALFVAEGEYRNLSRQLLVAKFNTQAGEIAQVATVEVPGGSPTLQVSRDMRWLYCTGEHAGISCIDLDTLTVWRAFEIALLRGHEGTLAKRSDFFRIDPAIEDGDARIFHSPRLR
jgi:hypothetical protein